MKNRKLEIEDTAIAKLYQEKVQGFNTKKELALFLIKEPAADYSPELDFKLKT
ncbi:hypothetical protein WFZ85_10680 [Flavobacterium sp. j3]|uniref:Uncharacterized protein n=1 Tax=Flavobacterium aureirubrum TaxID=3133147 RepID=A0ABU9N5U7_9FLAO